MVNKFEAYGIAISVGAMVLALWLIRVETSSSTLALLQEENEHVEVYVGDNSNQRAAVVSALEAATDDTGTIQKLVINDVVVGAGSAVENGDSVSVHYIGTLQSGQQFDNSYVKGAPFTFEVGKGRVIDGWEEGVLGMKVGGQRILVIPSDMAYGDKGFGPIPGGATLVFAIELISINE